MLRIGPFRCKCKRQFDVNVVYFGAAYGLSLPALFKLNDSQTLLYVKYFLDTVVYAMMLVHFSRQLYVNARGICVVQRKESSISSDAQHNHAWQTRSSIPVWKMKTRVSENGLPKYNNAVRLLLTDIKCITTKNFSVVKDRKSY